MESNFVALFTTAVLSGSAFFCKEGIKKWISTFFSNYSKNKINIIFFIVIGSVAVAIFTSTKYIVKPPTPIITKPSLHLSNAIRSKEVRCNGMDEVNVCEFITNADIKRMKDSGLKANKH